MGDLTETVTPSAVTKTTTTVAPTPTPSSRTLPIREDCWSEEATSTLVDAWGNRYLELSRGNLRQKDWQEVAHAVNALHAHSKKSHRTDVQCKNRIDTIKKKYKVEKGRVLGGLSSSWAFFERMDALIGSSFTASGGGSAGKNKQVVSPSVSPSPPVAVPLAYRRSMNVNYTPVSVTPPHEAAVVALPQKRWRSNDENNYLRRNYSAAAATESESDEEEEVVVARGGEEDDAEGMRVLARAIERLGQVYQRVERQKVKQMLALEKQRMKFAKDLEMERMRIFTDTQIQLLNIRRGY